MKAIETALKDIKKELKLQTVKTLKAIKKYKYMFYISELLKVIRETESDELTSVMQRLVCSYTEEVTPIAVEMMTHLVSICWMVYPCTLEQFRSFQNHERKSSK